MGTVGVHIDDVVKTVDGRCGKAIGHHGDAAGSQGCRVGQGLAEEQRDEYKDILYPLVRAYDAQRSTQFGSHRLHAFITLCSI